MAALVAEPGFGPDELRGVLAQLPAYARPVFIRIVQAIEITGTFKLRKQELAQEGYDPRRVSDPIYIADAVNDRYVALDAQRHAQLEAGTLRL
jgi:fatty-acyl-CoA synthase